MRGLGSLVAELAWPRPAGVGADVDVGPVVGKGNIVQVVVGGELIPVAVEGSRVGNTAPVVGKGIYAGILGGRSHIAPGYTQYSVGIDQVGGNGHHQVVAHIVVEIGHLVELEAVPAGVDANIA